MNGVTMVLLSPRWAQWNWIIRADADYLQLDGKTLWSFTVASYMIYLYLGIVYKVVDSICIFYVYEYIVTDISDLSETP